MALVGLFFLFLAVETHGRANEVETEPGLIGGSDYTALNSACSLEDVNGAADAVPPPRSRSHSHKWGEKGTVWDAKELHQFRLRPDALPVGSRFVAGAAAAPRLLGIQHDADNTTSDLFHNQTFL